MKVECVRLRDGALPPMVGLLISFNADANACETLDISYEIVAVSL